MAVKDGPSKGKRGVIEPRGDLPKIAEGNEEDTETAIDSPYARDHRGRPEDDDAPPSSDRGNAGEADDEAETKGDDDAKPSDDKPAHDASRKRRAGAKVAAEAGGAHGKELAAAAMSAATAATRTDELVPWLVPAYIAGLLFLLVGERVVPTDESLRYAFSGLGVLATVATTLYRARSLMGGKGERARVERTLATLMGVGLLALAVYFATTDTGRNLFGISAMKAETRPRDRRLTIAWVLGLAVSVVPLAFGEIALAPMRRAERFELRRVRAATIAGATLAFAASYVALFTYAAGEVDQKLDFSYYRTSRPGESTKNLAATLTEPVEVLAFFPQLNDVGDEVKGYLTELSQASPQLQVKFQDRLLVPALAKELKVNADGVLVLKRGDNKETMTIGAEMKTAQVKLKTLDADFQKALLKAMRAARNAYLTVGHGELNELSGAAAAEGRSAKNLKRLLESQNYAVKDLGLAQGLAGNVPEDARIVLILGPSQPFMPEEIASLKRYADRGGRVLVALDPDSKVDLAPLAEAFGLKWKPVLLATDDARHFYPLRHNDSDHIILLTNRFSSHASVSSLSKISQRTAVVFRGAAALEKAEGATGTVDFAVRALAETFEDDNGNFLFDKESEKRQSYNLAAAISRPTGEKDKDGKDKEARVFALGDADALSDGAVGDTPNGLMAIDAIRWLGGDESFLGAVSSNEDVKIEHSKQAQSVWFYATIFAVPLGVLGLGFISTRRRNKGARRSA
ncbi:MAG: Gldg family protein [Polyangiaceae bacterium]